jgi:hypothetical protein
VRDVHVWGGRSVVAFKFPHVLEAKYFPIGIC